MKVSFIRLPSQNRLSVLICNNVQKCGFLSTDTEVFCHAKLHQCSLWMTALFISDIHSETGGSHLGHTRTYKGLNKYKLDGSEGGREGGRPRLWVYLPPITPSLPESVNKMSK